jgi:hypothetical protein
MTGRRICAGILAALRAKSRLTLTVWAVEPHAVFTVIFAHRLSLHSLGQKRGYRQPAIKPLIVRRKIIAITIHDPALFIQVPGICINVVKEWGIAAVYYLNPWLRVSQLTR